MINKKRNEGIEEGVNEYEYELGIEVYIKE